MTAREFLESTFKVGDEYQVRHRAKCVDGWSVSIQGGTRFHYCSPRELCNVYDSVELGFPSHGEPELMEYAEDKRSCRQTVYGLVPIAVIEAVVSRHGGIKPW